MNGQLNWFKGGLLLGAAFLIGVSTQLVIADGIVWNLFSDKVVQGASESKSGYASPNAYLYKNGGKYAKTLPIPSTTALSLLSLWSWGRFCPRG